MCQEWPHWVQGRGRREVQRLDRRQGPLHPAQPAQSRLPLRHGREGRLGRLGRSAAAIRGRGESGGEEEAALRTRYSGYWVPQTVRLVVMVGILINSVWHHVNG